jgi:protein SCO1/2
VTRVLAALLALALALPPEAVAAPALPFYEDATFTPQWQPVAHRVGDFELRDQQGAVRRGTDLRGRIHVASFFFTTCPVVCPNLTARLRRVQEAIAGHDDVQLVSFSVTPEVDDPQRLAAFGATHQVDPTRWWLLTGERAQIQRLFSRSYFADDLRLADSDEFLLHTERVLLVDAEGRLRGVYNGSQAFEMERLVEDIAALRAGS